MRRTNFDLKISNKNFIEFLKTLKIEKNDFFANLALYEPHFSKQTVIIYQFIKIYRSDLFELFSTKLEHFKIAIINKKYGIC